MVIFIGIYVDVNIDIDVHIWAIPGYRMGVCTELLHQIINRTELTLGNSCGSLSWWCRVEEQQCLVLRHA